MGAGIKNEDIVTEQRLYAVAHYRAVRMTKSRCKTLCLNEFVIVQYLFPLPLLLHSPPFSHQLWALAG